MPVRLCTFVKTIGEKQTCRLHWDSGRPLHCRNIHTYLVFVKFSLSYTDASGLLNSVRAQICLWCEHIFCITKLGLMQDLCNLCFIESTYIQSGTSVFHEDTLEKLHVLLDFSFFYQLFWQFWFLTPAVRFFSRKI